jgi:hypothetical protein
MPIKEHSQEWLCHKEKSEAEITEITELTEKRSGDWGLRQWGKNA